jgi:hypothetical protein
LDLLKRSLPSHGLLPRPVDLFERELPQTWLLTDERSGVRRDVVGLFNWDAKKSLRMRCTAEYIGLPKADRYVAFDYWDNRFVPPFSNQLDAVVPAGACRILAVRAVSDHPQVISTSRHITQGVVDIIKERWDEASGVLTVDSRVVAGDRYELRIVVPASEQSWVALTATCGELATSCEQDGPVLRVAFTPAASTDVSCRIAFRRGSAVLVAPAAPTEANGEVGYGRIRLGWVSRGEVSTVLTREPAFADGARVMQESAYLDDDVEPGTEYRYMLRAQNYAGQQSPATTLTVRSAARPVRPVLPPEPTIPISGLQALKATTGWGKVAKNRSCQGNPLTLDGKQHAQGMGVHATSLLVYTIPAGAKRFVAHVGIDDEMKDRKEASLVFKIYGDVKEMGEPPALIAESPMLCAATLRIWCFDVELSERFRELRLVVDDAGDGISCDHADWVNAGFLK